MSFFGSRGGIGSRGDAATMSQIIERRASNLSMARVANGFGAFTDIPTPIMVTALTEI
jgi:hypothetical protein